MSDQLTYEHPSVGRSDRFVETEPQETSGLVDGIRFLYARRLGLAVRFLALLGLGIIVLLFLYLTAPTSVHGTVGLGFRGIERHEYPSGRKFTVEDFRSPAVLTEALRDAGIPEQKLDLRRLTAQMFVMPVVPADVQARWKKQEKDGAKKDEYFPTEFNIAIPAGGLSSAERVRLFDAIVKSYQGRVKYEQRAALNFVGGGSGTSYEKLAASYDFWDIPTLFHQTHQSLDIALRSVILESLQYRDSKYHLGFRNVARELSNWFIIRLRTLEAVTFEGRLVKNKELTLQLVQHRLEEINVQIKQRTQEVSEGMRLLGLINRPGALLAGQLSGEKGVPIVDASAVDKLIKNDYVGPVVEKISRIQSTTQELEAEKARLQKQLASLPKATNVDFARLPSGHKEVIQVLSSELESIVQNYNRLLDEYLTASVTSLVTVRQSAVMTRDRPSLVLSLIGIVCLSFVLAISLMSVEHLFRRAKEPARTAADLAPTVTR